MIKNLVNDGTNTDSVDTTTDTVTTNESEVKTTVETATVQTENKLAKKDNTAINLLIIAFVIIAAIMCINYFFSKVKENS